MSSTPRLLYVGAFDIPGLMAKAARREAPSNHVHSLPEVHASGLAVRTLEFSSHEMASAWAFERRIWREAQPDELVVAHTYYSVRRLAVLRRLGLFKPRLCGFVHSFKPRPWDRSCLLGFDLLLPLTKVVEEELQHLNLGQPLPPIIPMGADLAFYPRAPEVVRDIVLSVGVSGRDFATLIEAAPHIKAPVHIVGRLRPEDAERARQCGITLHSSGNYDLPFADMNALYRRASCAVVVTHGSDHPYGTNGVVEGMALSCPVVMTGARGIDIDPVADGFGDRVAAHDPAALADAVNRIIGDPTRVAQLGAAARATAESKYNTKIMANALMTAFEQLPT